MSSELRVDEATANAKKLSVVKEFVERLNANAAGSISLLRGCPSPPPARETRGVPAGGAAGPTACLARTPRVYNASFFDQFFILFCLCICPRQGYFK